MPEARPDPIDRMVKKNYNDHESVMSKDQSYYRLALRIFADFGITIAAPAVFAALLGKWLDEKMTTEPFFFISLLLIALLSTGILVYKKAKYYQKQLELIEKK